MSHQTKKRGEDDHQDDGAARNYGSAMIPLGKDFTPGADDVLVGRGKVCRNWQGNARFRDLVASKLDEYSAATSKLEKSAIVQTILYQIRTNSPKGGFIKKDPLTGQWYEVGDFVARERVTQSFRDALHGKYRSSNTSKKQRRREELKRAKEVPPTKKLKEAPQQPLASLRTSEPQPSAQPQMTGLQSMMLPTTTAMPSSLPLETRSTLFDQPLSSSLSTGLSAQAVSGSVGMPPLTGQQGTSNTPLASRSLEQQLFALQRLNQSVRFALPRRVDERPIQQEGPYPSSWFRVKSGESLLQNLMSDLSASSAPNLGNGVAATVAASSLANESFTLSNQVGQAAQARRSSSMTSALPPSIDLAGYAGDENPFEPVPIAENISRRHSLNNNKDKQA